MMKIFLVLCLVLGSLYLNEASKKIKVKKIAEKINNKKNHPWQASSYDFNEIDADVFIKSRLGVQMKGKPPKLTIQNDDYDFSEKILEQLQRERENRMESSITSESNQLPENFTWATAPQNQSHGCKIEIKDQANCGSCWAVSTVSAFGDRLCLSTKGKMNTPLSSNLVVGCNKMNFGCNGGYMNFVYNFLQKNGTVTGGEFDSDEGCQPYSIRPCGFPHNFPCASSNSFSPKCKNGTCTNQNYSKKKETTFYKINGRTSLYGITETMKEIYYKGPITATFYVYNDFLSYKKGVYIHTYGWWPLGGHAVRVVGWGVEKGVKYWHVSNSWGDKWGEDGYFKIIRGVNNCQFENMLDAANVTKS